MDLRYAMESVKQIRNDMLSLFEEVANEKSIQFKIELSEDVPECISTDKLRIEQIIKNLLSNAFKFTNSGGSVSLRIKRPDKKIVFKNPGLRIHKNVVEFSVHDTGIGIPNDKQQIIFDAFQQADGSTNRKYGGTGLGLSISRMLVALLGGELQLTSEENKGSTFFLFVPMENEQASDIANSNTYVETGLESTSIPAPRIAGKEEKIKQAGAVSSVNSLHSKEKKLSHDSVLETTRITLQHSNSLREKRILIVDQDMRNVYALTKLLEQQGMLVWAVASGREALDTIHVKGFDIILMDLSLNEPEGIHAVKEIRKQKRFNEIPVIVQAKDSTGHKRERYLQLGVNDIIAKPFQQDQLLSLLQVWLHKN
jgi:two-component system chemotaxis sensor kinase CheA